MVDSAIEAEWHRAAERAKAASKIWTDAGIRKRLLVLQAIGARINANIDELEAAYVRLGFSKAVAHNMTVVQGGVPYFTNPKRLERYARELLRPVRASDGSLDLLVRRPDGVVLLMLAAHVAMMPLVDILLPGNAVVLRARTIDPVTAYVTEVFHQELRAHGMPTELLSIISGRSREVAAALLPSAAIGSVVFFGKHEAGQQIAEQAGRLGKKVILEMEASDSIIVWRDADVDQAVESACSAWLMSNQVCVTPRRALVHHDIADEFLQKFVARTPAFATSMEADREGGHLMPVWRLDDVDPILDELLQAGGQLVLGGYRMDASGQRDPEGSYLSPTILSCAADACRGRRLRSFTEECPLPVFPVVRFSGDDDTIMRSMAALVGEIPFGFRISVWCRASEAITFFARELAHVGLLMFNEQHLRPPHWGSPSGGPLRSGGPWGESIFFWEHTSRLQSVRCCGLSEDGINAVLSSFGAITSTVPSDAK